MDAQQLISQLSPPLDRQLIGTLIDEFISMKRRYFLTDWEPATLDGGQFSEIAAHLLYHMDSGNLNRRKRLNQCLKYIEDETGQNAHGLTPRKTSLHLCKVLRTIYKFRSQRGAIHIDPDYTANEMDSAMLIANVRWIMSELLRVFWSGSQNDIARVIREITRYEVPAVLELDDRHLVLRTDCNVEEEILILLHNAGETGLDRTQLGKSIPKAAPTVSNAISRLVAPTKREVVKRASDNKYILTPNGDKRVLEELAEKLSLD